MTYGEKSLDRGALLHLAPLAGEVEIFVQREFRVRGDRRVFTVLGVCGSRPLTPALSARALLVAIPQKRGEGVSRERFE
jgi:hypothetical protein